LAAASIVLAFAAGSSLAATWVGGLAAAGLLTLPMMAVWSASHCADVPTAYLLLASVTGLATLDRPLVARPSPVAVGFALGSLAWIKDEGVVLAGLSLAVWAGLRALRGRPLGKVALWIALGALPGVLALAAFKISWAAVKPASFFGPHFLPRLVDPERWRLPVRMIGGRLFLPSPAWPVAWWTVWLPLVAALPFKGARRNRAGWLLLSVPLLALGIFLLIYVVTPYGQEWHIGASLDRLLLQLHPSASLGGLVLLFAAWRSARRSPGQSSSSMRR
jgi:hypothetical protein